MVIRYLLLSAALFFITSCQQGEIDIESTENTKNTQQTISDRSENLPDDVKQYIKDSLHLDVSEQKLNKYVISPTHGTGSVVVEKISSTDYVIKNSASATDSFKLEVNGDENKLKNYIVTHNGEYGNITEYLPLFDINNNGGTSEFVAPCDEHISFSSCWVSHWNSFCDDIISCIAQEVNPVLVGIAIAIHCWC